MPVIRTRVHTEQLVENQNMQELSDKVQKIINKNRGQIQHWCNARRQNYSLNTSRVDKKTYALDQLTLTHTIIFDQEYIDLDVYPVAEQEKEEDRLCLMVLADDTIYAIPMSQLSAPATMEITYQKQLQDVSLGEDVLYHRQYKFVGAEIGFFLGRFNFANDSVAEGGTALHMTPIDKDVKYSKAITDFNAANCAINGSEQTVYLPSGKYQYTKNAVTQLETFNFGAVPYAFDSSGTAYFSLGIFTRTGNRTLANGLTFNFGSGLTPEMGAQVESYVASNITSYVYTGPYGDLCLNSTVHLATAANGTVPNNAVNVKSAFQNGYPQFDAPVTDLSLPFSCPVFSTGSGDRIELKPYSVSASAQITYDALTGESSIGVLDIIYGFFPALRDSIPCPNYSWYSDVGVGFGWGSQVVTSATSLSFDKINVSQIDEIRGPNSNGPPYLYVDVYPEFPTVGGPMYIYQHQTSVHSTGLPNTDYPENYAVRGTDTQGGGFIWSLMPDKEAVYPDYNVRPLAHISNGVHYIQAVELSTYGLGGTTTRHVFCDGIDISPILQNLGIDKWNLMAMDIPLKRIKKFT